MEVSEIQNPSICTSSYSFEQYILCIILLILKTTINYNIRKTVFERSWPHAIYTDDFCKTRIKDI